MTRLTLLVLALAVCGYATAQTTTTPAKYRIGMDIAHGQKFWHDPSRMAGMDPGFVDRVKYMTTEFGKTAASVDAQFVYFTGEIKPEQLAACNLVFIHIPSVRYTPAEVSAINSYMNNGGSMFLVMDSDYWSTLEQTNVNDLIRTWGIQFGGPNPDTLSGGSTRAGKITKRALKIPFHGARIVTGGTPFCYSDRTEDFPFGTFTKTKNGGKLIAMGDGMVSLYMTSWEGVNDYPCADFMHDAFDWLLRK